MIRFQTTFLLVMVFLASALPASAFPEYLEAFKADPFRRATVDGCNTCHMTAAGGDERNDFGQAFEKANGMFTPLLRAQWPDRFSYPVARVSETMIVHFSDPGNKQIVIESVGKHTVVDVEKKAIDGKAAATDAGGVAQLAPVPHMPSSPRPASVASVLAVLLQERRGDGRGSHEH